MRVLAHYHHLAERPSLWARAHTVALKLLLTLLTLSSLEGHQDGRRACPGRANLLGVLMTVFWGTCVLLFVPIAQHLRAACFLWRQFEIDRPAFGVACQL